ncbi:DNA (cytosine-5-)-methyltransferase [Lacticaseibacillus paracasei]|uniref:DNA cytosine methyltransferase n=1 Tax=Lacticaseibacillus paracasei TaxID=1597 RepID=UPI0021B0751A|nr:DNA (cytosine-5-)-methyltransferase [Lacticaseibacillus paracasei]UWY24039.1 DNA (cytosine-5-)-methyltransferase [Lacticaseibacillus paracasei]
MRSLELFAGIGGIALAEQMAGIEVAGLCEYADYPRMILQKHWPDVPLFKDVTKLDREELTNAGISPDSIDIVSGGFPCQPFSIAGHRKGTEDDRDLWPEMFRIIQQVCPTWVVGENVANFANMELDRTLSDLEGAGYQARAFVLPACAVNAPHQRLRTFIVAHADSKRWICLEKGKQDGRDWEPTPWTDAQEGQTSCWINARHILASGTRVLASTSRRIPRNDDGISEGLDRLKALGNAVVPQQILPIFKAIVQIEDIKDD